MPAICGRGSAAEERIIVGKRSLRVGVVVPMVTECSVLFGEVDFQVRRKVDLWEVHETVIGGVTVGVVVSDVGTVNAAAATQAVLQSWQPDIVTLVGCAGAISPELLPGDVVIAKSLAHYSNYQTLPDGQVNLDIPAIRVRTDYTLSADRKRFAGGKRIRSRFIYPDPRLHRLAMEAGASREPDMIMWPAACQWPQPFRRPKCASGVIGTADQINSDPDVLKLMVSRYGLDVEECEGVAVGQVALAHQVPFLVIRGISDNELINPAYGEYLRTGAGEAMDWVETESTRNAWMVFLEMVRRLGSGGLTS